MRRRSLCPMAVPDGANPFRKRNLSDEQRAEAGERLKRARDKKLALKLQGENLSDGRGGALAAL
jgi:hypothetical protein